jgi:hypothetical protein
MSIYKLHYAKLDLQGDIPCYELNGMDGVINFVSEILNQNSEGIIYLIAIENEVFVTENCALAYELFSNHLDAAYPFYENEAIFIQEYSSYEEAYEVALSIKEVSPFCYQSNNNSGSPIQPLLD